MGRAGMGGGGGHPMGGGHSMGSRAGGGHPMGGGPGHPMGGRPGHPMTGGPGHPMPPRRHVSPAGAMLAGAMVGAAFAPRHRCPPPPYGYRYNTSYTYDDCVAVLNALYNIRDGYETAQDRFVVREYFGRDVMPGEAADLVLWMEDYLR